MTSKKFITLGAILLGIIGLPVLAGRISLQPTYNDPRFLPADMFHAGCVQEAQVSFEGKEKNISKMHLELAYAPEELEITRIVGADQVIANYRIEYDRIVFDIDNPKIDDQTSLFTMTFKSKKSTITSDVSVATGSYIVSNGKIIYLNELFSLQFAEVPECDPDVVAPSIDLVFPQDPTQRISLDQYFVFEIKDSGKGIDKKGVKVYLNDQLYTADSANIKWKGDFLTFYPQDRLAVNKKMVVQVSAPDLQSYGGANTTDKVFSFKTATGMDLIDKIDPMTFRSLSREGEKIIGAPEECLLLQNILTTVDKTSQEYLSSIMSKIACDPTTMQSGNIFDEAHGAAPEETKNMTFVSVFAALGRILFVIALVLKFHYLAAYKKHKKIAQSLRH